MAASSQPTADQAATGAAESAHTPKAKPTGPVAFIKSHTTVLFKQRVRACKATATSPRGHDMVCDRPIPKSEIGHLLHAMVETREGGVRVIFWRIEGQKAKAPRAPRAKKAKAKASNAAPAGAV